VTKTMTRPPGGASGGPGVQVNRPAGAPRGPSLQRDRSSSLFAAEVALALVTMAAIVGMHRLFADGTYRPALLAQALAAHVVVALLRRARLPLVLAASATTLAAVFALAWGHYVDTTAALIPTGDTMTAVSNDLSAAWKLFQDVQAPAPVDTGFMVAAGAAVWLMVFVADWAAFRASATFEALLPSATLFLFAAALGAPGGRVAGAALYAAAAMLFVLLRRTLEQEATAAWASTHRSRGRWSLLGSGGVLVAIAVAAGAFAGPNLPGADDDPVIAWRDIGDGDDPRIVVSPIVDIKAKMLEQPDVELFTVRSNEPSYWRLTSLDDFDGATWKSSYGTSDAKGRLPHALEDDLPVRQVDQRYDIRALAQVWLPAAYEPVTLTAQGGEVDWDKRSSTLIVDKQETTSDGLKYQVTSDVPEWSDDELRTAPDTVPDDIRERYLQLPPGGLDPRIEELARQQTAGASTPFDRALALQSYLKSDQFTYDLDVPAGHSEDALVSFLFEAKRGYCEQFAGSFAALVRTIGIPSRVAVGFTPGIRNEQDPTLYQVRGEHAHAWVEVYLHGFGWVPFDPTPGRAPPGAQNWLGLSPEQDAPGGNGETPTPAPQPAVTASTVPAGPAAGTSDRPRGGEESVATGSPDASQDRETLLDNLRTLGVVALALLAAYLVLVPLALAVQATARRRRATTPDAKVRLAWHDSVDRAAAAGLPLPPSLTVGEAAGRLTHELPEVAPAVGHLAGLVERTVYAEIEPSPEDAADAGRARGEIVAAADKLLSPSRRILRHLDAPQLWRRGGAQRRRATYVSPATATQV
jgi:transglutaminase-like putative cysteine protease